MSDPTSRNPQFIEFVVYFSMENKHLDKFIHPESLFLYVFVFPQYFCAV